MILMQHSFNKINFLVGSALILEEMKSVRVKPIFDEGTVDFLGALSKKLLSDREAKQYPDIVSYAFWIRRQSLEKVRQEYAHCQDKIGRGVTFHIAPSNVPVNFAVSFTSALLAGNACAVRVSNKEFEQVAIITKALRELLEEDYAKMRPYLCIMRYEHDDDLTQMSSDMCDIRIIWGGNRTIEMVRNLKLPPRALEMTFADRHSIAMIQAEEYLKADAKKIAKDFYTDTYYTDQNACSSPRIVVWFGEDIARAQEVFWGELSDLVEEQYRLQPIMAVDKLSALCMLAAEHPCAHREGTDNLLTRVLLDEIPEDLMDYKNYGGYFFEYIAKDISEIHALYSKPCQTISYYGLDPEEIRRDLFDHGPRGGDRIVPIGKTMELSFRWDGYDMIDAMSRYVYVRKESR